MFKKILIANRGEIARRVMRSCKSLSIGAVAVYSEADADLPHVHDADEAVAIGPASPRESYLSVPTILDAAKQTGADAIHPGYGFLSENADFAQQVEAAGMTWIGPSPQSIRDMGDKHKAREIAIAAGVPVVPGSGSLTDMDDDAIVAEAEIVGYPLLVKAAGGGGGIGMRQVDKPEDVVKTVEATRSMAGKSFGNDTVFFERFIPRARHIEIQVFGFGDGNAVHVFERDCSLQRRFQKVIEESPAPLLPEDVRQKMADAALALCRQTKYSGAGTVEFIVDAETFEFFFLEMNTRIQVEHPVTEMVTGTDLVAMQIEHAAGELTAMEQSSIKLNGAAIECRLYAEDPKKKFFPSPGTLNVFRIPEGLENVRIDTGYKEGDAVTPYYDPMVAKVIVWGEDRDAARALAVEVLGKIEVDGIRTNKDFLIACLQHKPFAAGDVFTGYIDANLAELLPG